MVASCKGLGWLLGFFLPMSFLAINDGSAPDGVRYSVAGLGLVGLVLGLFGYFADWLVSAIVKDAGYTATTKKLGHFRERLTLTKGSESFEAGSYYDALEKLLGLVPK